MGKWNRRYLYLPRNSYREYEYEDPPLSPPRNCHDPSNSAGVTESGVPTWEIDYCKSVRISWNKVLTSKKYMYTHPSIMNWDDSSGKEAFENAKQRYWAMINGLPCETPLPDPNMYIEEINGYAYVDPKLVEDLERQYFNPDTDVNFGRLETINEEVSGKKYEPTILNLWEANNNIQGQDAAVEGWGDWGNSVNLKNNNPWEQSSNQQPLDSWKASAWRTEDESWGWKQGQNNNYTGSSCNYGSSHMAGRHEGWDRNEKSTSYWSDKNARGSNNSRNSVNFRNTGGNNHSTWKDNVGGSWGRGESGVQLDEPNRYGSGSFNRSGNSFRGGGRKRENCSGQHPSKYKSSRYQGHSNHGDRWQA